MRAMSEIDVPLDSGDFGLLDRKVVEAMRRLPEHERFVRGLRSFVGFRQTGLEYERHERSAGATKYTLRKLLTLAIDGLVSFSAAPLMWILYAGGLTLLLSIILATAVAREIVFGGAPDGWRVTITMGLFFSAIQLLSMGIIGQYIRRMFWEVKGRPTYIVSDVRTSPRNRIAA
jgi:polyisoprenyl-phosphate glycosyltransferase